MRSPLYFWFPQFSPMMSEERMSETMSWFTLNSFHVQWLADLDVYGSFYHFVLILSPISIVRLSILMMQQINIAESLFEWGYIADNWWYTVSFCITRWRKGGNNLIEVLFDLNFLFPVQSVMIILNQFQLTRHSIVPMIKQFLWPSDAMSCPSTTQTYDHCRQHYHWLTVFCYI